MTNTLITVHGYNANPDSVDPDDHPTLQQEAFRRALDPDGKRKVVPFNWFSAVMKKNVFDAWGNGYWNTYQWAYCDLSLKAADRLVQTIRETAGRVDLFAHSLGSRVVLQALERIAYKVDRILILNGAELSFEASLVMARVVTHSNIQVLNICSRTDDVLDKAAGWMSPGWKFWEKDEIMGQDGLFKLVLYPRDTHPNIREIFLDKFSTQMLYKELYGFDIRGDNPNDLGDHHYSYKWAGNHRLYQAFLNDRIK